MNKQQSNKIICIGSVLWDVIGKSNQVMSLGSDIGGQIIRIPGGVAFNIAKKFAQLDFIPLILSAISSDNDGDSLTMHCKSLNMITEYIYRPSDLKCDTYMAIEGKNGVIAAIADAHSLEKAGQSILLPLIDGRIGSDNNPYTGTIVLDGNLTTEVLKFIAHSSAFKKCDLRIVPASPGKAERLMPFFGCNNVTFYVNLNEAETLCQTEFKDAKSAALQMLELGANSVVVTNGNHPAAFANLDGDTYTASPPKVHVNRLTGAGDTFMAAHIVALQNNMDHQSALEHAVQAAAEYVAG